MGGRVYAGGRVYTGAGRLRQADILVEGGIIRRIAPRIVGEGQERVDCAGLILAPGFIDLHAHLREPGFEEKETIASGTALAKRSGFQTVCAMPNLNPAPDAPETARVELEAIGAGRAGGHAHLWHDYQGPCRARTGGYRRPRAPGVRL